jgi:dipeptidyl aminopeptidase/acylaminoacyl peptidase
MSHDLKDIKSIVDFDEILSSDIKSLDAKSHEAIIKNTSLSQFYRLTYLSQSSKIQGYLVIPKATAKFPCIIYNRGGVGDFGKLTDEIVLKYLGFYASQGFVVIASQYAGNAGSEGQDEFGGDDLHGVLCLESLLKNIPQADTDNIFMLGTSRGGMMTYLALTKVNWIRATATIGGIANMQRNYALRPKLKEFHRQFYDVDDKMELTKRSAVHWVEKMSKNTPLLLLHGEKDDKVSVLDCLELATELHKKQHPFSVSVFENGDHGLSNFKNERNHMVLDWFKAHVYI